ncbi:MAG: hypothetical protein NTZ12_00180 [Candidatus Aminicenantes bacterium]|nr:hypothetical protein [Candidatus Aminicenantes bacterium]
MNKTELVKAIAEKTNLKISETNNPRFKKSFDRGWGGGMFEVEV